MITPEDFYRGMKWEELPNNYNLLHSTEAIPSVWPTIVNQVVWLRIRHKVPPSYVRRNKK